MKIYLLTQNENTGYDTYDSCVVAAENEDEARKIHPHMNTDYSAWRVGYWLRIWCSDPKYVKVEYIGEADKSVKKGVILASFNAG